MSRLSDRQLPTVMRRLPTPQGLVGPNLPATRAIATLSAQQLARARSDAGYELRAPSPRQMALLCDVFQRGNVRPPVRIWVRQHPTGTAMDFEDQVGRSPGRWAYQGPAVRTEPPADPQ